VAVFAEDEKERSAIRRQADMIRRASDRLVEEPLDRRDIRERDENVLRSDPAGSASGSGAPPGI
jgi:hypothetical protein